MAEDAEQQCVFCHIANGRIPAKKVFEDDKVTAVLDINPAAQGHILLIPKEHVAVMPQADDGLVAHLGMVAKQLSSSLLRAFKCEGVSVFVANGAAAGQRAPHVMVHVIPRSQNDGVGLVLSERKIDEKTLIAVFNKLGPAIGKVLGKEPPKLEKVMISEKPLEKQGADNEPDQKQSGQTQSKQKGEQKAVLKAKPKSSLDDISEFLTGGK